MFIMQRTSDKELPQSIEPDLHALCISHLDYNHRIKPALSSPLQQLKMQS